MEMTTLSDTPRSIISSASDGVSIKIEQGVLYSDSCDKSKIKVEMAEVSKGIGNSNLSPRADHIFNGVHDDYSLFNITHSIFQPDFSIKTEPEEDIDDRHPEEEAEESNKSLNLQLYNDVSITKPTPTNKLIASGNGIPNNKRRYVCTYENCTKSYGKSSHLRSHLTWHTGIKPFVCKESSCGKGFTRSDELNRHIRTHTGEKPFECMQCTKKFSRSDHLTKHLATHSKQLSANSNLITKKMKIEKKPSISNLKTFPATPPSANNASQNSQFINVVDHSKSRSACLNNTNEENLRIKQEISDSNPDCWNTMPNQKQNLNLSLTSSMQDLLLKNEYNLVIKPELKEPHVSESLKKSIEPYDDKAIMPEANLPPIVQNSTLNRLIAKSEDSSLLKNSINHVADSVYDPTRPFPCSNCAKNFKRQDDLNRHIRTHTGEKPFACRECEKRFMRSDHLKKHLRTHAKTR